MSHPFEGKSNETRFGVNSSHVHVWTTVWIRELRKTIFKKQHNWVKLNIAYCLLVLDERYPLTMLKICSHVSQQIFFKYVDLLNHRYVSIHSTQPCQTVRPKMPPQTETDVRPLLLIFKIFLFRIFRSSADGLKHNLRTPSIKFSGP
jgi:hypothetical protein